jgi:16S rRNA (uracil1498-N3)-methyltransferase
LFYLPTLAALPPGQTVRLDAEESRHCVRVLRLRPGHQLQFTDGAGTWAEAALALADPRGCQVRLLRVEARPPERPYRLHLAIAPTKNPDRMEWLVEKATEVGVDQISFLYTQHTEREHFNLDRMHKKAVAALKQSQRAWLPRLAGPLPLAQFWPTVGAAAKFIAYVDPANPVTLFGAAEPGKHYCVLVGPEGDFAPAELAQAQAEGFRPVSLGSSRLRTETAGLVACQILATVQEKARV